ncbi:hypothetical protein EYF80_009857 [Liparis tanakae]|uniref:Uncharacterized protein n=1 Tax=Liparis tanakae TaxID=230148 RepID=A0A4Z2IP75_9TELE|nr:hypothetical protein EYF80_009857 [Liparis tanakae]
MSVSHRSLICTEKAAESHLEQQPNGRRLNTPLATPNPSLKDGPLPRLLNRHADKRKTIRRFGSTRRDPPPPPGSSNQQPVLLIDGLQQLSRNQWLDSNPLDIRIVFDNMILNVFSCNSA